MNKKCEMCGGEIIFKPGETYGICDSCGARVDLDISHLDKAEIQNQVMYQKQHLLILEEEKQKIINQLSDLDKIKVKKNCNIVQLIMSLLPYIILIFLISTSNDSEPSTGVMTLSAILYLITFIVSPVLLIKYSDVFNKSKKMTATIRAILIVLLQYFTGFMFGIVVGIIDLINITEKKKYMPSIQAKLQKQLEQIDKQIENEENYTKNYIEFKL